MSTKEEMISTVYNELKNRVINPKGEFDRMGRFYAKNADLIEVREPSKRWPYSHMSACRTKKYVTAVAEKYGCENVDELRTCV